MFKMAIVTNKLYENNVYTEFSTCFGFIFLLKQLSVFSRN